MKEEFGPHHPLLGEPEYFRVELEDGRIASVDYGLGYNYRAIESRVRSFTWPKAIVLLGRICGICSSAHTQAFALAFERINGLRISRREKFIRMLGAELERIHSHLLWLGLLGDSVGMDTLFTNAWETREHALNMLEIFTGKRIHYNHVSLGGVMFDIPEAMLPELKRELGALKAGFRQTRELFSSSDVLATRLEGIGKLDRSMAEELGVVGPVARATGIRTDTRLLGYHAYGDVDFEVPTRRKGDAYARAEVRLDEVGESIRLVEQLLELPRGRVRKPNLLIQSREGVAEAVVEAPRGENFHYLRAGKLAPAFLRVRPPTFANLPALSVMLKGMTMSDLPVVVNSLDPCFACLDRTVVVDRDTGKRREVSL